MRASAAGCLHYRSVEGRSGRQRGSHGRLQVRGGWLPGGDAPRPAPLIAPGLVCVKCLRGKRQQMRRCCCCSWIMQQSFACCCCMQDSTCCICCIIHEKRQHFLLFPPPCFLLFFLSPRINCDGCLTSCICGALINDAPPRPSAP